MNAYIDRINWVNDPRTQGPAEPPVLYLDDQEIELPTRWDVCPVCEGEGRHVNPSIDCNGLSPEQFADDPEFLDDYVSGRFDVVCSHCKGRTTVPVVDWDRMSPEHVEAYESQLRADAEYAAMARAEFIAGC